jgi:putative transposase
MACYLYRAIDRDGNLIDTMLSATRDMKAARRFFRSARSVAGFVPDRVTTDGHNSYPRAIRSTLGRNVRHRTSVYLNNRLEQDHRGIKGRIRFMRASRSMRRQTGFAENMTNYATSSAADPVTTNTFQQPAAAVTFSSTPAS